MADAIDSVEKLTEDVGKLSKSLGELQGGFSNVGKAIPTDGITKLSSTIVDLQRHLSLSAERLDKLKESITKVGQATKFYNDIELTSLVKQLQESGTAFGRAAASSEKYLELLVNKFPVGAETAIRSLNQMSKTIPELSLSLQEGTKAQYDYATALSIVTQYGQEGLNTYNQLTSVLSGSTAQELENIKTTKDFQREVTQLSLELQKDFIPVIHTVTELMKEMHNTFGDGPAKILVYAVALGSLGKSLVFIKEGLTGLAGLTGLRALMAGGTGAAAAGGGGTAIAGGGAVAATGTLGSAAMTGGLAVGALGLGFIIGKTIKEAVLSQYYKEEEIFRELRRSPEEKASIARGEAFARGGGMAGMLTNDIMARGKSESQQETREAAGATGVNRLLHQRLAIFKELQASEEAISILEKEQQTGTMKFKEIATARLQSLESFRDASQRVSEYYDIQQSQLESQAKILENMNRPLGERSTILLKEIRLLKEKYDVQESFLKQMQKDGKDSVEIEKQKAVVLGIQEQITSKALMARRTWMEQMTAQAIGLPSGSYVLPNEIPGVQSLGAGYQAFRNARPGDKFGGTLENMRGMLENEAWPGGSAWRTPVEQDAGEIMKKQSDTAERSLKVQEEIRDALRGKADSSPQQTNKEKSRNGMSGLTGQSRP